MARIGYDFGKRLLDLLGIESKDVVGFTLRVYADEIVSVKVERHANCDKLEQVLDLVEGINGTEDKTYQA